VTVSSCCKGSKQRSIKQTCDEWTVTASVINVCYTDRDMWKYSGLQSVSGFFYFILLDRRSSSPHSPQFHAATDVLKRLTHPTTSIHWRHWHTCYSTECSPAWSKPTRCQTAKHYPKPLQCFSVTHNTKHHSKKTEYNNLSAPWCCQLNDRIKSTVMPQQFPMLGTSLP